MRAGLESVQATPPGLGEHPESRGERGVLTATRPLSLAANLHHVLRGVPIAGVDLHGPSPFPETRTEGQRSNRHAIPLQEPRARRARAWLLEEGSATAGIP